ncbi:ATP-binding protein [uncultured Bradyrhizobium sp.]|jgi:signal transduction histidine kinase|uniref:ATP-binding protein n=1 Tax=uncultured Bradyrhizobium sp. TaxID=199684 RepID=UPI00260FFC2A|nr:ATP-binding protein [uncultured Bradyrhizobium sp.]
MSKDAVPDSAVEGRNDNLAAPEGTLGADIGLINLQPTRRQNWTALAAVAALAIAVAAVAPFAATPLPRFAAFIPFLNATILVTDLITAILLFGHFSISRLRGLLVLSGGYLFTALIVIPHALTFPGAFSETGLLGAGLQTTAWLYIFWHLGFPISLGIYACLKDEPYGVQGSMSSAIGWCVALIVSLVLALVWAAVVWDRYLPRLFLSASGLTPLGTYIPFFDLIICALALACLWGHRRSVLDLWLMVVACALIGELALTVVRFSLGFYVSRILSLATSTIVLVILLTETTGSYTRLARANLMLRRERENKLMNLEAVVASISHEVKQPLATIVMRGSTALRFLGHSPPDLGKARSALNNIVSEGHRASQIFDNIRDLFRAHNQELKPIDVNDMALRVLDTMQGELMERRIETRAELMPGLPVVWGHRGQLQEVILNLIRNAIEAMDAVGSGRVLRLTTEKRPNDGISIKVIDSGPGISPEKLDTIFDAFVTSKAQGMGLGLAICRLIVERHGGQLLAFSNLGSGAQFEINLPIMRPDAAAN